MRKAEASNQAGGRGSLDMRNQFIEHLVNKGHINHTVAANLEKWLRHAPQPIGMIAMSHGLMTGQAIDEVLQRQEDTDEKFGEIAVKMTYLTPAQVDRLLDVQRFRRCTTVVEGLSLSGQMSIEQATEAFADFLRETPTPIGAGD